NEVVLLHVAVGQRAVEIVNQSYGKGVFHSRGGFIESKVNEKFQYFCRKQGNPVPNGRMRRRGYGMILAAASRIVFSETEL
ncbi:MAG: hypothetical protein K2M66_03285, partial [Alistipes sp.]|nr:hypothetical protein [Alistipes sp.]